MLPLETTGLYRLVVSNEETLLSVEGLTIG